MGRSSFLADGFGTEECGLGRYDATCPCIPGQGYGIIVPEPKNQR